MILQKREEFRKRGYEAALKMLDVIANFKTRNPVLFTIVTATLFILVVTATSAFAESETAETIGEAARNVVGDLKCLLEGGVGWLLIAFGVLLAVWDYFIQKQGSLLVVAVIGILVIIILRQVLPGGPCEGSVSS